jgi:SMODS domain-containing protein
MWIGVRQRFTAFHKELLLTQDQIDDGLTKQWGVRSKLQEAYYPNGDPEGFMVGSWGKGTQVRPPRDVDVFFVLPYDVYYRFEQRSGNKQSALLQEIKEKLLDKYPQTDMRGDGQVVMVKFKRLYPRFYRPLINISSPILMTAAHGDSRTLGHKLFESRLSIKLRREMSDAWREC